jgi:hypothetical protein
MSNTKRPATNLRVEPFIHGFLTGIRPQLTSADRDLLTALFETDPPFLGSHPSVSFDEERNPLDAAHYFRLGRNHLNVLVPVWILNGRKAADTDRFRIGFTEDHSVIVDTKESLVYDPSVETLHTVHSYSPLRLGTSWREETLFRIREDLLSHSLEVLSLSRRLEQLPLAFEAFKAHVKKHKLQKSVPSFKMALNLASSRQDTLKEIALHRALFEAVIRELWERSLLGTRTS